MHPSVAIVIILKGFICDPQNSSSSGDDSDKFAAAATLLSAANVIQQRPECMKARFSIVLDESDNVPA